MYHNLCNYHSLDPNKIQNVGCMGRSKTDLRIQRLNNLSYLLQCLNSSTVCTLWAQTSADENTETIDHQKKIKAYIGLWFIEHKQTSSTLVQNAVDNLVENHL